MHRIAENFAERVVEDVRCGMVEHRRVAADAIDLQLKNFALQKLADVAAQEFTDVSN